MPSVRYVHSAPRSPGILKIYAIFDAVFFGYCAEYRKENLPNSRAKRHARKHQFCFIILIYLGRKNLKLTKPVKKSI